MSGYTLVGFAAPSRVRPTFLIPYFTSRSSNGTFAQELDTNQEIASFLLFNPDHYERLPDLPQPADYKIGDKGVLAVADALDAITYGNAEEVGRALRTLDLANTTGRFFAVDAMTFLRDRKGLRDAVKRASLSFQGHGFAGRWITRAYRTAALAMSQQDRPIKGSEHSTENEIDELGKTAALLEQRPELNNWVKIWFSAVQAHGKHPQLVTLAEWWLSQYLGTDPSLRLLRELLRWQEPSKVTTRLAKQWLDTLKFENRYWYSIWILLAGPRGRIAPDIASLGLELLHNFMEFAGETARGSINWMRVWSRLYNEGSAERELDVLAQSFRPERSQSARFVSDVILKPSRPGQYAGWRQMWLREWITDTDDKTSVFPSVLLLILAEDEDPAVIKVALKWLDEGNPNLKLWASVWHRIRFRADPDLMILIALRWLARANVEMQIWPEMMSLMLEELSLEQVYLLRPQAVEWLRLGRAHPARIEIQNFVNHFTIGDEDRTEIAPERHGESALSSASLKEFLNSRYGPDARVSEYTYTWTERLLRRLGFDSISALDAAISDIDDRLVSKLATGRVLGQTSRLEVVLLWVMGDVFIDRHEFSDLSWFREQQATWLNNLRGSGIDRLGADRE